MKLLKLSEKKRRHFYLGIIILYFLIALFAPILANEKPIFFSFNGKYYFPAINNNAYSELPDSSGAPVKIRTNTIDWKNLKADEIIFAPICWSPSHSDLLNTYSSPFSRQQYYKDEKIVDLPFRFRHFLGTGKTGNDVLAGLIYGSRTSVSIGFFSMSIAIIIGIFLGGFAGYLGDDKLKLRRGSIILSVLMLTPAWFYSFQIRFEIIKESFSNSTIMGLFQVAFSFFIFIGLIAWPIFIRFKQLTVLDKKISIPVDSMVSRFIEIFLSLPRLILILTIAAISQPSVITIILIIGFTAWTEIARMMRAQILQLREMNYIAAAKAFGTSTTKILYRHLLPNALPQIIVIWTLGIATAILTETGLSFLGIGVPPETATWGSLMFEAKENYQAWWLVLFTGGAIFSLLSALYLLGNKLKSQNAKSAFLS